MPIGAGGMSGLNCHASPPSPSGTTRGALSWNFRGMYCVHRWGGSRMWESAEMSLYSRAMGTGPPARVIRTNVRRGQLAGALPSRVGRGRVRSAARLLVVGTPARIDVLAVGRVGALIAGVADAVMVAVGAGRVGARGATVPVVRETVAVEVVIAGIADAVAVEVVLARIAHVRAVVVAARDG